MRTTIARLVFLVPLCVAACGGDRGEGGDTPTGPSAPAPPPPSGVASIAGDWSGTSDVQQNGVRSVSNLTASITQTDRNITGTVRFTSAGWEGWQATITGTVAGTSPDTQFVGDVAWQSPSTTGTGICVGQVRMAGRSIANSMRWEGPVVTMTSNVPTQPASACRGALFTPTWIFFR